MDKSGAGGSIWNMCRGIRVMQTDEKFSVEKTAVQATVALMFFLQTAQNVTALHSPGHGTRREKAVIQSKRATQAMGKSGCQHTHTFSLSHTLTV